MSQAKDFDNGLAVTMGAAALTSVSFSTWDNKKVSRELANAIAEQRGIDRRLVSSKVTLMEDSTLAAIYQVRDNGRRWWWHNTLPYRIKGIRIWPEDIDRFTSHVITVRDDMNRLADELASNWPDRVEAQRANLRGEFDAAKYPTSDEIRGLFGVRIGQITPLYLDPEMLPQILRDNPEIARQQLDDAKASLAEGMGDIWHRTEEALEQIIKRLGGNGRLHETSTLMATLGGIVDVLPKLNIANDPALNDIAKALKEKVLTISDINLVTAGKEQRAAVADAARSVMPKIKARGASGGKVTKAPAPKKVVEAPKPVARKVVQGYQL